jgi:hypothetical protein
MRIRRIRVTSKTSAVPSGYFKNSRTFSSGFPLGALACDTSTARLSRINFGHYAYLYIAL